MTHPKFESRSRPGKTWLHEALLAVEEKRDATQARLEAMPPSTARWPVEAEAWRLDGVSYQLSLLLDAQDEAGTVGIAHKLLGDKVHIRRLERAHPELTVGSDGGTDAP